MNTFFLHDLSKPIILTFLLFNNKFLRRIQVLDEAAAAQTASHKLGKVTPPPQNGR